jgi:hypothetical protein
VVIPRTRCTWLVIRQDTIVEVGDNGFERLMAADLSVDTGHGVSESRRRFAADVCALPGCNKGLTPPARGM